ncbi:MAG TPA: hypothetical protein VFD37_00735 [Solirubrobacterales bacterium]|nr:hypothetical protein [Solirubrobacterales bacterium]
MKLFGRGERQTGKERREFRDHLAELDILLEDGLENLGAAIAAIGPGGKRDARALWQKAARISAIEDEIRVVERGITERLTRDQLYELANRELGGGADGAGGAVGGNAGGGNSGGRAGGSPGDQPSREFALGDTGEYTLDDTGEFPETGEYPITGEGPNDQR